MLHRVHTLFTHHKGFVSVEVIIIAGILISGAAFTMNIYSRQATVQNQDSQAMMNSGQELSAKSITKLSETFNGAPGSTYGIEGPAWNAKS